MSLPVFEAWLQEHRAVCRGVKFEMTPHAGYGARVVKGVGANSTVLAIPRSFLIDFSAAVRSSIGKAIKSLQPHLSDFSEAERERISIFALLLHEKGVQREKSFWWPYIQLLPQSFDSALWFSEAELRWIQGTTLVPRIKNMNEKLQRIHQRVFVEHLCREEPANFPPAACSFEELRWAHSVWWSRAIGVPLPAPPLLEAGAAHVGALVPLVDILNHSPTSLLR